MILNIDESQQDLITHWFPIQFIGTGKGIVQDAVYNHFIHLSMVMTSMSAEDDDRRNGCLPYCRQLLQYFVEQAPRVYENGFAVYNVHGVQHIPDDVQRHNLPLHQIDAFGFENALKGLKRMVKGPQNPVAQIYRKNIEGRKKVKNDVSASFKISSRPKDCCFETDNKILLVQKVNGEKISCHSYQKSSLRNISRMPDESAMFGIYYIPRGTGYTSVEMRKEQLKFKCVNLPFKDGIAVIPMVDGEYYPNL